MTFTRESLRQKIIEARKELEDLEATERVMMRFDGQEPSDQESKAPVLSDTGVINLEDLQLPAKPPKKKVTLADELNAMILRFGSQEFSVSHVVAALRQSGKGSDAKHFGNRVSIGIRKLAEDGVLVRTHKGKGNDPHRYKQAKQVSLVKNAGED